MAPWLALCELVDVLGQLDQVLGQRDADAGWDADPTMNVRPDLVGTLHQVAGDGVVAHLMAHNFNALDLLVFSWRGEAHRHAHARRIHPGQCMGTDTEVEGRFFGEFGSFRIYSSSPIIDLP